MPASLHIPISLIFGALFTLAGTLIWPQLIPLRILAAIMMMSGYWGVLQLMGLSRPLNRLAGVFALYGAMGQGVWLLSPEAPQSFGVLYVFGLLSAMLITSIAAVHRQNALRTAGFVGMAAVGTPLAFIIGGHLLLGGFGVLGLSMGVSGISGESLRIWPVEVVFLVWAVFAGGFLVLRGETLRDSMEKLS